MFFGFVNILKPPGMTSHDLVAFLRRVLGQKQIGHSGTLDPNAAGVMVLALGPATKLLQFLESTGKEYIGLLRLGMTTDTADADGAIIKENPDASVSFDQLQQYLFQFTGEISQTPPQFSAVRVEGRRLYEYARSGQDVEVPVRQVLISDLSLEPLDLKKSRFEYGDLLRLKVRCGEGTYIRSIARDLGELAGTGAHLAALVRTCNHHFTLESSFTLNEFTRLVQEGKTAQALISPQDALPFPIIRLTETEYGLVSHGNRIPDNQAAASGQHFSLTYQNKLIAVAVSRQEYLQPLKVLHHD